MAKRGHTEDRGKRAATTDEERIPMPRPTASYRRRAWVAFQRALDPLAPIKPLPRRRT